MSNFADIFHMVLYAPIKSVGLIGFSSIRIKSVKDDIGITIVQKLP